jgi:hypothetical protein
MPDDDDDDCSMQDVIKQHSVQHYCASPHGRNNLAAGCPIHRAATIPRIQGTHRKGVRLHATAQAHTQVNHTMHVLATYKADMRSKKHVPGL